MSQKWDYEDDHDWDDNVDYAAEGYVYWYGKYYPKEHIASLFPPENVVDGRKLTGFLVLGSGLAAGVWGAVKAAPTISKWWKSNFR